MSDTNGELTLGEETEVADLDQENEIGDGEDEVGDDTAVDADDADLEAIKKRMQEMEEEAQKLREFQAEADDSLNLSGSTAPAATSPMLTPDEKKEIDGRSIYVGNVDYGATAEELESHFHGCGPINRVTINCDKYTGHPKGFAYIEFTDSDSIEAARALDESLFRGRQIKVVAKRTNIPGHSTTNRPPRGRGRGRYRGFRGGFRGRSPYRGGYRGRGRYNNYYSPY